MAKRTLDKKEFYTEEELLTLRIPRSETRDEILMKNIYNVMFQRVGRDYAWAKAHDLEDLHVIDIVVFKSEKEHDEFHNVLTKIIQKQLGFSKRESEEEASWFQFGGGLSYVINPEIDGKRTLCLTEDKFKENLRYRIKQYEEKNGELKYSDGYETELKEYCGYGVD